MDYWLNLTLNNPFVVLLLLPIFNTTKTSHIFVFIFIFLEDFFGVNFIWGF